jgi:hypothetical protein
MSPAGAAAAQAAEPYGCAAKNLQPSGWGTRTSPIKNARTGTGPSATLDLYSGSAEMCWRQHRTVAPGVGRRCQ